MIDPFGKVMLNAINRGSATDEEMLQMEDVARDMIIGIRKHYLGEGCTMSNETKLNGFALSELKNIRDRAEYAMGMGLVDEWTADYKFLFQSASKLISRMEDFELVKIANGNEDWRFVKYRDPDKVNWLGWIEVKGDPIAWIGLDRKILFKHELDIIPPIDSEVQA